MYCVGHRILCFIRYSIQLMEDDTTAFKTLLKTVDSSMPEIFSVFIPKFWKAFPVVAIFRKTLSWNQQVHYFICSYTQDVHIVQQWRQLNGASATESEATMLPWTYPCQKDSSTWRLVREHVGGWVLQVVAEARGSSIIKTQREIRIEERTNRTTSTIRLIPDR